MLEVNVCSGFYTCPPERQGIRQIHNWQPAPARELLQMLGIDLNELGLLTVNGQKISLDEIIPDNVKVAIWPFYYGG